MTRPKAPFSKPVIGLLLAASLAIAPMASPTPAMQSMHSTAHAQTNPACSTLPGAVYISGSSASRPLIREAQRALQLSGEAVTFVYQSTASCDGVSSVLNDTAVTATANYFTFTDATNPATVVTNTCTLPIAGVHPDIAVSDVSAAACGRNLTGSFDLGTDHTELQGAVQSMTFVVPTASTQTSISGEAARVVFGFGGVTHTIAPWIVTGELFHRPSSSGTQIIVGENIGLASTRWMGSEQSGSTDVRDHVQAASAASVGILASDVADASRDHLRILAYQHVGQSCGYLPDSSSTTTDKANVREGRYALFNAMRFIVNTGSGGVVLPQSGATAANVQRALDFVTISSSLAPADGELMVRAAATASTIPLCAMHVTRATESSVPVTAEPSAPCHGLFESIVGTPPGRTAATACTSDAACTAGTAHTCRFGFCEEH
jgi:ABC-type phosphate transport system substrate-binding protein